jgi:threonine dehydrogenase-like Zn-dependent dehydrogenase
MKTLQIMGVADARVVELDIPEPAAGQVLVKVTEVNTCPHWDMHIYRGKPMFAGAGPIPYPYTAGQPGHEMVGVAVKVGAGVEGLKAGDRVVSWKDQGHDRQGCYAQYVVQEAHHLLPVPPNLEDRQVASLELAMCIAATILDLKAAQALANKLVGISGTGPAGLIAAQMAKAEGASQVLGFDYNAARRELALTLDVDRAIDPRTEEGTNLPARGHAGVMQTSIDCVGGWPSVRYLMDHTSEIVAIFGVQREPYPYNHGSLKLFGYPGHYRAAAEYALGLIAAGKVDLTPLVSHRLPFTEYDQAVRLLEAQEAMKVCFLPWA